jgi:hypothetical protein
MPLDNFLGKTLSDSLRSERLAACLHGDEADEEDGDVDSDRDGSDKLFRGA